MALYYKTKIDNVRIIIYHVLCAFCDNIERSISKVNDFCFDRPFGFSLYFIVILEFTAGALISNIYDTFHWKLSHEQSVLVNYMVRFKLSN